MENTQSWWLAFVFGVVPLLAWLLFSWNELRYLTPLKLHSGSTNIPPGNMGLPIIGELISFIWYYKIVRRPDDFINSKRGRYGDGVGLYRTYLFGSPTIIAWSPESNKFVLQSFDVFSTGMLSTELFGQNSSSLVAGKVHSRLRNFAMASVNTSDALKRITAMTQPLLVASLRSWAEKGKMKALDEVKKMTFVNICNVIISFEPGRMMDMLMDCFMGLFAGLSAQPLKIPGTTYYKAIQCRKKLIEVLREELEKRKLSCSASEEKNDLMDGLMRMRDEDGKPLSDEEIAEHIMGLILAGYEATSVVSMWVLYYLAKHHDVAQKLREENLGMEKKGDYVTSEDLGQLKYTNKVVEETIRMANVMHFIIRVAKKDVSYKGYTIPKDWNVVAWISYLHTDPENFKNPMKFNPDRWNEPPRPGTYQAFGWGPRLCAGNKMARTQIALFIHHLVIGYRWELVNPDAMMEYLPQPRPVDGLEIVFTEI